MMKKLLSVFLASTLFLFGTASAWAISFTFEGTFGDVEIGTNASDAEKAAYAYDQSVYGPDEVLASAFMDISVSGNIITATLENSSPTALSDGRSNASGITDFGFDLANSPILTSWSLEAFDSIAQPITIGEMGSNLAWKMDDKMSGINVDFLPNTKNENIKGALYNPLAVNGLAALPNFFTTATLTLEFDNIPTLDFTGEWSPFVRMMNVGADGEYSLKMTPVPEPATMLLFGTGLVGLAGMARRKRKK